MCGWLLCAWRRGEFDPHLEWPWPCLSAYPVRGKPRVVTPKWGSGFNDHMIGEYDSQIWVQTQKWASTSQRLWQKMSFHHWIHGWVPVTHDSETGSICASTTRESESESVAVTVLCLLCVLCVLCVVDLFPEVGGPRWRYITTVTAWLSQCTVAAWLSQCTVTAWLSQCTVTAWL